ncbi:MAG: hypothetical protein M4579_006591 [Chaenotheca gracillima]|nr:MAG: hypothetical protein M4579_006591 [Chaenotheca gracillima]
MESLADTVWDVVISGTGLQQSLLALNDFYGGPDAALSLQEANAWVEKVKQGFAPTFRDASVSSPKESSVDSDGSGPKLSFSRAYSLSLSPYSIYTRSRLLPVLVSSRVYRQLEFQAVGHWWILDAAKSNIQFGQVSSREQADAEKPAGSLKKVPNGREDIFADTSIDFKSKRCLMKFLKFVGSYEEQPEVWEQKAEMPFPEFLSTSFNISTRLHAPLLAIAMCSEEPSKTTTALALSRIARHLRSIGVFGPGFGAVLPKWGGGAEIAQVACRACAVGGGVYVLGQAIESIDDAEMPSDSQSSERLLEACLQGGERVRTRWVIGTESDLPDKSNANMKKTPLAEPLLLTSCLRSVSVVSSALKSLFPITAEGAPPPAGAVVTIPTATFAEVSESKSEEAPPVYILVHSSETGECPPGQSVLYASMLAHGEASHETLDRAVRTLLEAVEEEEPRQVLYTLNYTQSGSLPRAESEDSSVFPQSPAAGQSDDSRILVFPPPSLDLAFDDSIIGLVETAWRRIIFGPDSVPEDEFMVFEDRENFGTDDDD